MSTGFEEHNENASDFKICVVVFHEGNLVKEVEVNIPMKGNQSSIGQPAIKISLNEDDIRHGKTNQCEACGKWYKNNHSLAQHKHVKHSGAGGKDRKKKCKQCNTLYNLCSYYSHPCVQNAKNHNV